MLFFQETIWLISEHELSPSQAWQLKCAKILLLSLQGFKQNLCELRASALTLYTVLSIVPIIAMLFGVAKGFGFENKLQEQLLKQIPRQETTVIKLIGFAQNMLANTQGGIVAGMGVILLFWTVVKVIGTIEESFNQIWQIKQDRTLGRKLTDYLSLMLLAPILLILASSITVFFNTQVNWLVKTLNMPSLGSSLLLYTLNFFPVVIMSALFSFVFVFLPNQKIQWSAGIIAGIITGIMYQSAQSLYVNLQIGVSSYNAIYGSFAAVPLFFVWLQLGWLIVLWGCEISFYIQNYDLYQHNKDFSKVSFAVKKVLALQIIHAIVQRFANAQPALSLSEIAAQFELPHLAVQTILVELIACGIVVEIKSASELETQFQPAQDIDLLTVYAVIESLEKRGEPFIPPPGRFEPFIKINESFNQYLKNAPENYLLKHLGSQHES